MTTDAQQTSEAIAITVPAAGESVLEQLLEHFPEMFLTAIVGRLESTDARVLSLVSKTLAVVDESTPTANSQHEYRASGFVNSESRAQWALEQGCELDERLCTYAAASGQLDVLIYLRSVGCPWSEEVCEFAAKNHRGDILSWARSNDCPWNGKTCAAAAAVGDLNLLQWARRNGCPWSADTCACAAGSGDLKILRWARENGCSWTSLTCVSAAEGGHLGVLQWAHGEGCPLTPMVYEGAASHGSIEIMNWLCAAGCWFDSICAIFAANAGHIQVLEWIEDGYRTGGLTDNSEGLYDIASAAAKNGHIKVLSWAITNGYSVANDAFILAAGNGHLDTLQWLRANVRDIDETRDTHTSGAIRSRVCEAAARGGHINVLEWERSIGKRWSHSVFAGAALGGHLDVLEWLFDNSSAQTIHNVRTSGIEFCTLAAQSGKISVLRWFLRLGLVANDGVSTAAARLGHFTLLKWAENNGCPLSPLVAMFAAQGGHLEIVKWAFPKTQLWQRVNEIACAHGHAEIFDWTLQNGCFATVRAAKIACDSQHLYLARRVLAAQTSSFKQIPAHLLEWMGQDLEDARMSTLADEQQLNNMYAIISSITDFPDYP